MIISFKKPRYQTVLFQGILSIAIGALLMISPRITFQSIMRFFGFILLVLVVFNLITAYINNRHSKGNTILTIGGSIMFVLGFLMLFFPMIFAKIFLILVGIILLFAGISQIYVAIQYRFMKGLSWVNFAIGLGIAGGAVYFITRPSDAADKFISLIGIFIMAHGFSELFLSSRIRAARKTDPNYIEEADHTEV